MQEYWQANPCGDRYLVGPSIQEGLQEHAKTRYELEPYIPAFARFGDAAGKRVCEIGVGVGADHERWMHSSPALLVGVDLTQKAIELTRTRTKSTTLSVADAEHLPLGDSTFDIVYSWGVIHHSPETHLAVAEIHRILNVGGTARVMIYNRRSIVALLLWTKYGLLAGQPRRGLTEIMAKHLESPGTKGYTEAEATEMFAMFRKVDVRTQLSFGDLLLGQAGERHAGRVGTWVKRLWPRWFVRRFLNRFGLYLLIDAEK